MILYAYAYAYTKSARAATWERVRLTAEDGSPRQFSLFVMSYEEK
jgi:hypothetical protein